MAEKIYHIRWNDHESLIRATSNMNCREQAQLLYGRDALSPRMCPVKVVDNENLIRLVRGGKQVLHFTTPVARQAIITAEKQIYSRSNKGSSYTNHLKGDSEHTNG